MGFIWLPRLPGITVGASGRVSIVLKTRALERSSLQEPLRDGGPAGPEPADPADGRGRGPAGEGKLPAVRGRTRRGRPRDPRRLVADRGGPLADAADQARLNFNLKFNLRAAAGKPRASPVPSWAGAGPGAGATNPAADPAVQVSRARRGRGAGAEISLAGGPRKNPPACGSPVPQGLLQAKAADLPSVLQAASLKSHAHRASNDKRQRAVEKS